MYVFMLFGVVFLSSILILLKYSKSYRELDHQYGKPYKARLVKLVGTHPEFTSGIYTIAFHPNGAISLNHKIIKYSEIKELEIVERMEKSENCRHYLVLSLQDDYGENQLFLTSKMEFVAIANELKRSWIKSKIC